MLIFFFYKCCLLLLFPSCRVPAYKLSHYHGYGILYVRCVCECVRVGERVSLTTKIMPEISTPASAFSVLSDFCVESLAFNRLHQPITIAFISSSNSSVEFRLQSNGTSQPDMSSRPAHPGNEWVVVGK